MSTPVSTDLMLVERGGALYKCTKAAWDAGVTSSDFILVERSSALYKETFGNKANVDAGDLIIVERGTSLYKCAWSDWDSGTSGGGGAGSQLFTTLGAQQFTAPAGVTSVYIVCIGGGGGGLEYSSGYYSMNGGGGGGLATKTYSVTPGSQYTVYVGQGGNHGYYSTGSGPGYATYFVYYCTRF